MNVNVNVMCRTPPCKKSCQQYYGENYEDDKSILGETGPEAGHFDGHGLVERIQREIMANGPVETAFSVYNDFYYYRSGIYEVELFGISCTCFLFVKLSKNMT